MTIVESIIYFIVLYLIHLFSLNYISKRFEIDININFNLLISIIFPLTFLISKSLISGQYLGFSFWISFYLILFYMSIKKQFDLENKQIIKLSLGNLIISLIILIIILIIVFLLFG
ncbi:hypothetical protein HOK68_01005 [Candidatus Woesearchaeota archaeon]|jgi:hypothetical protein|nr:hypothetical protein [Candidatus Woesearchaeota archaeon]MBT4387693.1 hypothetical protein [Candidatus Woesearchaeota archaeon]MBT4595945.1 hypothetical protein [Candidatus Woesearchaeota archaeon]MBT5741075.1 hypothetical protein [Candidatus Woesearchaeota archaeon]MBT6505339.1 hypothetical protein [Candidatus Woesearchaeota archaeon]